LIALAVRMKSDESGALHWAESESAKSETQTRTIRYFGDYELLEEIAHGGMGVVYRARQVSLNRPVALKMILAGQLATPASVQRFHTEAEAAARLDHPNIVPIYEIGEYDGQHYFSMKLIEGGTLANRMADFGLQDADWRGAADASPTVPLSHPSVPLSHPMGEGLGVRVLRENSSIPIAQSTPEPAEEGRARHSVRAGLWQMRKRRARSDAPYLEVHEQRGESRGEGGPSLSKSEIRSRQSKIASLMATVARAVHYAHQRGLLHRDLKPTNILIDDRGQAHVSDFGLAKLIESDAGLSKTGAVLGTPSYMSPDQAAGRIKELTTAADVYSLGAILYELLSGQPPFRAETALETLRQVCERQPARPRALNPQVDRDLETICLKCLSKDPQKRYGSAEMLAQDLDHWRNGEPILARPVSTPEKVWRWCLRRPVVAGLSVAVLIALVAGLVVSDWFYLREKAAHQQAVAAEKEAVDAEKEAQAIVQFLTEDLLFQATPEQNSREKQITLEQALTDATRRLDQNAEIRQQPKVEATLRLAIGRTYHQLWLSTEADRNLRRAFELRHRELGPTNSLTLDAEFWLGTFLEDLAHEYEGAGTLLREVWQGRQQLLGPEHADTLQALQGYQITLYQTAHFKEAEQIARYLLPIRERTLGSNDAATIDALLNLEGCVAQQGDHTQAEALCRELLRRCDPNGSNKFARFVAVKDLASHRTMQGDPAGADRLMSDAVPQAAREFGADSLLTLHLQRVLARAFADEGCFVEAEALARATLEARLRQKSDPQGDGRTMLILGRALAQQGKLDQAEALLQTALPLLREHIHTKDAGAVLAANWLGAIQASRKAYREAENLMLPDSDRLFDAAAQLSPTEVRLAVGNIIALYDAWEKPGQAAFWRRKLQTFAPSANQSALNGSRPR